jgi:hypothetical protein
VPYLKCVPCKIRVSKAGVDTALTDGRCPACGLALEPVVRLTEVMGFRSAPDAQFETDRWLDEGGSFAPELLAEMVAVDVPQRGSR